MMDEKDREIIQLLQDKFPLVSEPYKEIGDKIWMDEVSVISRIAKMIQDATRHFGPATVKLVAWLSAGECAQMIELVPLQR